ncbi:MAG: hypothetical protein EXQ91_06260 [Alphaproteobacteria bacterium]|nr:hypothetical protein [Alphaproteobacteria bacterium]
MRIASTRQRLRPILLASVAFLAAPGAAGAQEPIIIGGSGLPPIEVNLAAAGPLVTPDFRRALGRPDSARRPPEVDIGGLRVPADPTTRRESRRKGAAQPATQSKETAVAPGVGAPTGRSAIRAAPERTGPRIPATLLPAEVGSTVQSAAAPSQLEQATPRTVPPEPPASARSQDRPSNNLIARPATTPAKDSVSAPLTLPAPPSATERTAPAKTPDKPAAARSNNAAVPPSPTAPAAPRASVARLEAPPLTAPPPPTLPGSAASAPALTAPPPPLAPPPFAPPSTSAAAPAPPPRAPPPVVSSPATTAALPALAPARTPPAPVTDRVAPPPRTVEAPPSRPTQTASLPPPSNGPILAKVVFPDGAIKLSGASAEQLRAIAKSMATSDTRLQVQSYATPVGADTSSGARRLSLTRALEIRSFLIEQGVKGTLIDVRALGAPPDSQGDRVEIIALTP